MKFNILYLHETSGFSGAEESLLNLVRFIDHNKFEPLFILPDEGKFSGKLRDNNVRVFIVPMPSIRRMLGVIPSVKSMLKIASENNARIVHTNSIRTHIYGAYIAKRLGIPIVWHERNLIWGELVDPDRLFSSIPDRIICNSGAVGKRFLRNGNLPVKVKIVYNGVDAVRFNPAIDGSNIREEFGIGHGEIVIGIASRFNLLKGHDTFLESARILCEDKRSGGESIRFLIAGGAVFPGDLKREEYLRKKAQYLGIVEKVVFTGLRDDMPSVYAAMDIFVLASYSEACGRVLLEAMASGKPIVGTDAGGTPEIVKDGVTGFLTRLGDAKALAEKTTVLIDSAAMRKDFGTAGRKRIEQNFLIEKNVKEIEDIYLDLIRK